MPIVETESGDNRDLEACEEMWLKRLKNVLRKAVSI
jgi:hypothetical protein